MKRQALVIGINEYLHLNPLKSAVNDAEAIATILEEQGNFNVKRIPSYKDENNRQRVHPKPNSKKAVTLKRLTDEIKNFFDPQGEQIPEVALLFFAGHGLSYEEFGKYHNFLAAVDSDPDQEFWGYHLDKLQELLKHSRIPEKIVWLDACHSGALIRDFDSQSNTKWCLISAAPDHDIADENQQQGVLTAALLKALDYKKNNITFIDSHALVKNLEQIRIQDGITQQFTYKNSEQSILLTGQYLAVKNETLIGVCPYKGLLYFDYQGHDPLFYKGRTALTAQLLDKVKKQRFVAVLGASGSGKSSLVRAGLIYQLQTGHNISGHWQILPIIRPGATPLAELTAVVAKLDQNYSEHLLIIDQFEEAFTLCQDEKQREAFFKQLLALTDLYLVIVMRADFFAQCIAKPYAGLADKIKNNLFTITPMTAEELKQAIEKPAEKVGYRVQELLTVEIIKDIADSPGNLPLLEYTLEKVFQAQDANQQLTLSAYQQLGGIKGALASKADELYQSFSESEQETVKWLFLELTRLGEGQEDTRKQLTLPELETSLGHRADLSAVIDILTKERLLIQDKNSSNVTIVDVAHEALIREWGRLRRWLNESRSALTKKREIEPAAKDWEEHRKSKYYLWQGPKLAMAEDYIKNDADQVPLSDLAQEFVQKSITNKKIKRNSLILVVTAVILVLAVIAFYANEQRRLADEQKVEAENQRDKAEKQQVEAEHQKKVAQVRQLGALALSATQRSGIINGWFDRALLLAVQAWRKMNVLTSQRNLLQVLQSNPKLDFYLPGHQNSINGQEIATNGFKPDSVQSIIFSPDGKLLAIVKNNKITLLDVETYTPVSQLSHPSNQNFFSVVFSHNSKLLASTLRHGIVVWEIEAQNSIKQLMDWHDDSFSPRHIVFSPDGKSLLSNDNEYPILHLWNVENKTFTHQSLKWDKDYYNSVSYYKSLSGIAFSPNGKWLANGISDSILIWNIENQIFIPQSYLINGSDSFLYDMKK